LRLLHLFKDLPKMSRSNETELDANEKEIAVAGSGSDSPKLSSTPGTDLDVTYDIYKRHAREELDPAEAKRVLRKIDLRVLPVLFVIYFLQYLDKNGINYASVYGLEDGTHLVGQVRDSQFIYYPSAN
jgi:hypothetical protein